MDEVPFVGNLNPEPIRKPRRLKSRMKVIIPCVLIIIVVAFAAWFFIFRSKAKSHPVVHSVYAPISEYLIVQNGVVSEQDEVRVSNGAESEEGAYEISSSYEEDIYVWPDSDLRQMRFCVDVINESKEANAELDIIIDFVDSSAKDAISSVTVGETATSKGNYRPTAYCVDHTFPEAKYMSDKYSLSYKVDVKRGGVTISSVDRYLLGSLTFDTNTSTAIPFEYDKVNKIAKKAVFPLDISKAQIKDDPVADGKQYDPNSNSSCINTHGDYCAIDLYAPTGTLVRSMTDGVVSTFNKNSSGSSQDGASVTIKSRHPSDGSIFYYSNLGKDQILVKAGAKIKAGTPLGYVGNDADAPNSKRHLHVDITRPPATKRPSCVGSACSSYQWDDVKKLVDIAWSNLPFRHPDEVIGICEPSLSGEELDEAIGLAYSAPTLDDIAARVELNKDFYIQAQQDTGVPWQALAVLHLLENSQSRVNPDNEQGLFGFYSIEKTGDNVFPPGPVDDEDFQYQLNLAASILKEKASYGANAGELLSQTPLNVLLDSYFGYNGKAQDYISQATSRGFDGNTQGYQGSPYVMNFVDDSRNPNISPDQWGQVRTDGGGLIYPASNAFVGAALMYEYLNGAYCSRTYTEWERGFDKEIDVYFLTDSIINGVKGDIENFYRDQDSDDVLYFNSLDSRGIEGGPVQSGLEAVQQDAAIIAKSRHVVIELGANKYEEDFKQSILALWRSISNIDPTIKVSWINLASAGDYPYLETYFDRNQVLDFNDYQNDGEHERYRVINWHYAVFGLRPNETDTVRVDSNGYLSDGLHIDQTSEGPNVMAGLIYCFLGNRDNSNFSIIDGYCQ